MKPLLNRIIPFANESLSSFLYRLSEKNYYNTPSWLQQLLDVDPKKINKINPNIHYQLDELDNLATITQESVEKLYSMTVHRFASVLTDSQSNIGDGSLWFEDFTHKNKIDFKSTKFCPECIKVGRYHRIHWELKSVTMCIEHNKLLLDRCAECNKKIKTIDIVKGYHSCGSKLMNQEAQDLSSNRLSVQSQRNIQLNLKIDGEYIECKSMQQKNLSSINPLIYFLAIDLLIHFINKTPNIDTLVEESEIGISNYWNLAGQNVNSNKHDHIVYSIAHKILEDWPNNFYKFLDLYSKTSKANHLNTGIYKDFGYFVYKIDTLKSTKLNFIKDAFKEYLVTRWDNGVVSNSNKYFRDTVGLLQKRQYVSLEEASQLLNIHYKHTIILLEKKMINYKILEANTSNYYQVSLSAVNELLDKWQTSLTLEDLARRLQTSVLIVEELIKENLLSSTVAIPDTSVQRIEISDIDKFEKLFLTGKDIKSPEIKAGLYLTLKEVSKTLGLEKYSTSKLLNLIEERVFTVYINNKRNGLNKIYFCIQEVERYKNTLEVTKKNKDVIKLYSRNQGKKVYLSITKIAKLLNVSSRLVNRWIENDLLRVQELKTRDDNIIKRVTSEDYINFRSQFLLVDEVAEILDVNISTVRRWTNSGLIKPCSSPDLDGSHRYLYKRKDIIPFEPHNRMSSVQAANYLGLSISKIYKAVDQGKLYPLEHTGTDKLRYYLFFKDELRRFKDKYDNELTLSDLSNLVKLRESKLRSMIKKGEIQPISGPSINGERKYLVNKNNIGDYIKIYNSSQVAEILGASDIAVRKWAKEGRIKAISGPGIDGKKYYRYRIIEINEFKNQLNELRKLKGEKGQYNLLTSTEVCKELGISRQRLSSMVKESIINPYRGPGIDDRLQYYFRPDDVDRLKERFNYSRDIVSASEAAILLNEDLSWFYKKWVKTNRLNTIEYQDKLGKYYFLKSDILDIVKLKQDTITGPEAAKLLGITRNTIFKWKNKGKIKPVAGPDIDGFGCYLYLKKEIEKLKNAD